MPIKNTVLGIDSSTQGVAWTIVQDSKPLAWGKINMSKIIGMDKKLKLVAQEFPLILAKYKPDHVVIEKTISVRNAATFRVLSYVVGALFVLAVSENYPVTDVEPSTWKNWHGYTNLTRKFTMAAAKKLGRLPAAKLCNQMRKSQTQRVHRENYPEFTGVDDHDISDSCAVALWYYSNKIKEIELRKTKEIALDLPELARLGLAGIL